MAFNYYELKRISAREYPNGYIGVQRTDDGGHKHMIDITMNQAAAVRAFVNAVVNQRSEA